MSASLGFVKIYIKHQNSDVVAEEVIRYTEFVRRCHKVDTEQMMAMHIGLGVCGEAGELADAIKREYIYNKPRNRKNIVEELGDLRWFIQACMNHYGIDEQEILQGNADKLSERYVGLAYTDAAAVARADKVNGE